MTTSNQLLNEKINTLLETENNLMLTTTVVTVANAGSREINGTYRFKGMHNKGGYFSRQGIFGDKIVQFIICKCVMKDQVNKWFISILHDENKPGTTADIDFYFGEGLSKDHTLPPTIWHCVKENHSRRPAPTVRCLAVGEA
eukprot:gene10341-13893_t